MNRWFASGLLILGASFPSFLWAQQVNRPAPVKDQPTAIPQAVTKPQPQVQTQSPARPIPVSRPSAGTNFSIPRPVRPSTPINQWNESRAVQIDVSQPSGTWDSQVYAPQVQTEFVPQDLNATSDTTLRINPADSGSPTGAPTVRSSAHHQHHPYQPGYVRKKLQKLGVASIPYPLANRAQLLDDDRAHSIIRAPRKGPDHRSLAAKPMSPREYNDELVRGPMSLIDQDPWRKSINQWNLSEVKPNHYYWHKDKSFNICHFLDASGNQWYGWYSGGSYFWTRCYGDHWWWYDSDFNRWCFWNDGWWWWQDPYHVGDLYFYNGAQYIPCNSANDQVEVTTVGLPNPVVTANADGTRVVKVMGAGQDAFLYDTAVPPDFNPVYLASKVQKVEFVDPGDGGAMEIDVTLSDGTLNYFDLQGNPLETTAMQPGTIPTEDPGAGTIPPPNP